MNALQIPTSPPLVNSPIVVGFSPPSPIDYANTPVLRQVSAFGPYRDGDSGATVDIIDVLLWLRVFGRDGADHLQCICCGPPPAFAVRKGFNALTLEEIEAVERPLSETAQALIDAAGVLGLIEEVVMSPLDSRFRVTPRGAALIESYILANL